VLPDVGCVKRYGKNILLKVTGDWGVKCVRSLRFAGIRGFSRYYQLPASTSFLFNIPVLLCIGLVVRAHRPDNISVVQRHLLRNIRLHTQPKGQIKQKIPCNIAFIGHLSTLDLPTLSTFPSFGSRSVMFLLKTGSASSVTALVLALRLPVFPR
jgi:hypothetical protein